MTPEERISSEGRPVGFDPQKASTVNRVRTPSDDVVDAWWEANVPAYTVAGAHVLQALIQLARQPEAVQRRVIRKARGL